MRCRLACHTILERLVRMLVTIVITTVWLHHMVVVVIENMRRIIAHMAIVMIGHVGVNISLIMREIHRFGTLIVARPMSMVIWRIPSGVSRFAKHIPHRRTLDKSRADNVVITIQIWVTYHLHI